MTNASQEPFVATPEYQSLMKEFNKPGGRADKIFDEVMRNLEAQRQEDLELIAYKKPQE